MYRFLGNLPLAAVGGANIVAGAERAEGEARGIIGQALFDKLADHAYEAAVGADSGGADEIEAEVGGFLPGFGVEVVDYFEVVGDEADGDGDNVGRARLLSSRHRCDFSERVANVGAKPGLVRRAAAALIDEPPVGVA